MENKIQLGELAFTAEDFSSVKMPMSNGRMKADCVLLTDAIKVANRILAEKIGRATEVSGLAEMINPAWTPRRHKRDTHTARLICIESLEDKADLAAAIEAEKEETVTLEEVKEKLEGEK